MSLIHVNRLTFAYAGSSDNIFENASFQIDTDWRLGFVGRNGRGKTTFLKLLMGEYPYGGKISASVSFTYFPYAVQDRACVTRVVFGGILPTHEAWRLMRELQLLGVSPDVLERPFGTLSNGEQTKVLLAAHFLKENSFLLIDEPTNHLDAAGRTSVARYLAGKRGFILVSHDRAFLDSCVDHILSINKMNVEVQKGNFSSWWRNKSMQDQFEQAENERLARDVGRLESAARRAASWSDRAESAKKGARNSGLRPDRGYLGHKSAKMMQRAKTIENRRTAAAEEKAALLKNIESAETLKLHPLVYRGGTLVRLENVGVCYGGKTVCSGVNLAVEPGDRIALSGGNGSGKSSVLRLICGRQVPHCGTLYRGRGLVISYVAQDAEHLSGRLTDFAGAAGIDTTLFLTILRKLGFSRTQFEKDMEAFSAGQRKKTLLAVSLCQHAHLYVWDEPLNYIDVISRIQLEELIAAYAPTLLFVEHDAAFSDAVATRRITL